MIVNSESARVAQPVVPSVDLAAAHIEALTGSANTVMDFRFIHDQNKGADAISRRGSLADCWTDLCHHNLNGYGCFIVIAETDGQGCKMPNVRALRAVYADLDSIDAHQRYEMACQWQPAPSFAVQSSPGRWHVYWLVEPFTDTARFTTLQRKIAVQFNGDPKVCDATRLMRLSGTLHLKTATPHLVRCWALPGYGKRIAVEALELPLAPVAVPVAGSGARVPLGQGDQAPSLDWLRYALTLVDPNEQSRGEWVSVAAAWKQAGWTLADEPTLRSIWDEFCARYERNDIAENTKVWKSIDATELGWRSLLHRIPELQAAITFGPNGPMVPQEVLPAVRYEIPATGETTGAPSHLDVLRMCRDLRIPVRHDTFADRLMVTGPLPGERQSRWPRPLADADYVTIRLAFNAMGTKPGTEPLREGVDFWARANPYDPVCDWLNGLVWDGVPRIDDWLSTYMGVVQSEWSRLIGSRFLIGMVARAQVPGCKLDTVLVLEGPQGVGKSTALRVLAGDEHFGDQLPNMKDKDGLAYLSGLWLVEIGELAAMRRSNADEVKSFLTSRFDRFRPSYGRHMIDQPRRMVFAASTNDAAWHDDPTGARRWWPVRCGWIDVDGLRRDRAQLFAEAVCRWRDGQAWHLDDAGEALARSEMAERKVPDPWLDPVSQYLSARPDAPVTMEALLNHLGLAASSSHSGHTRRLAGIFTELGYERKKCLPNRGYAYIRKCH